MADNDTTSNLQVIPAQKHQGNSKNIVKSSKPKPALVHPGRPTEYHPDFCRQARLLVQLGAIDEDMAEFWLISVQTLMSWKREYPEFLSAIKEAKDNFDNKVEKSLLERALGVKVAGKDDVYSVPPEVTACIFWLKNRRRERWSDVKKIEVEGTMEVQHNSTADIDKELARRGVVLTN